MWFSIFIIITIIVIIIVVIIIVIDVIVVIIIIIIIIIITIIILWYWVGNKQVNIVCLEILFGVDSYRMEPSQFICIPNQSAGFWIVQVSAEGNYRIDFNWYINYMTGWNYLYYFVFIYKNEKKLLETIILKNI